MTGAACLSPLPAARCRRIPASTAGFYGVGEIPITMTMVLLGLFGLFFYNSVLGLPAPLVALAFGAGLTLDAVMDPYIGYCSDRISSRFGRRHGFMLVGALGLGPCFFLLFSPPRLGQSFLFFWLLLVSALFRISSAVYRIPYLSLGAELSQDYDERTRIIAVRSLFGLLGAGAAAGLSFLLFSASASGADPKLNYGRYPILGMVFGLAMTLSALLAIWGTRAYRHPVHRPAAAPSRFAFFSGFRLAMRNPAFRTVWLSFTIFFLAVVLNASLAVHYFTWFAQIHNNRLLSLIQISFVAGALLGVLMWMSLAKHAEKRTLYAIGTLATALLLCCASLLVGPGRPFGIGNPIPFVVGHVAAGIFASALWVMPASMLADVADQDQLTTSLRREGIYFGILNFGEKLASVGSVTLVGLTLHYFVHLAPASAIQEPGVSSRLGAVYGLVPGLLAAASALLILSYPLNRRAVDQIQHDLAQSRPEATRV